MFTNESPPCSRSDRATQWLNLAGTFGGHPDYTYSSSWISISKESLLAASLGNLCQFWITFTVEVFQDSFPMYFQYFLLRPLPTVLQLATSKKNLLWSPF